jgi:hypothetical protein
MLVALAVLAITVPALAVFVSTTYTHSNRTLGQSTLQSEARAAVDTLVADLRQAYYGDTTTSPVVSISGTTITFYSPDRATPFHLRKISYRLTGGEFQRAIAISTDTVGPPWDGLTTLGPWATQLRNVTSASIFSYQDADGIATSDPAKVKRVTVTIQAKPSSSVAAATYESSATLRADR